MNFDFHDYFISKIMYWFLLLLCKEDGGIEEWQTVALKSYVWIPGHILTNYFGKLENGVVEALAW